MYNIIKVMWVTATVVMVVALLCFLLGTTAFFQRGIDLVTTFYYVVLWVPALIITVLSILSLVKRWRPENTYLHTGLILAFLIFSVIFSTVVFRWASTSDWLTEDVRSDYLQTTSDGKHEYKVELINLFQRNQHARLYVKNISTGEEVKIKINIKHKENINPMTADSRWRWSSLDTTETLDKYILTTTEYFTGDFTEKFEINMETKTSKRIE